MVRRERNAKMNYNAQWYTKSECGPKCRSIHCVKELNAVITKANIRQLKDYVWTHCPTSCQRCDNNGRYPLHVAASCGKIEILDWLITTFECDLNVQDEESSWTPLHRAIYYGRLACAVLLIEYGANLWLRDKDGFTAMDITMVDCTPWVKSLEFSRQTYEMPSVLSVADPSEVYTWGSNDNFILGHGNPRGGKLPEPLEYFSKRKINIKLVSMAKFHTVFITVDGTVFTCGHGEGGRLGNGRQDVCLEPAEMSFSPGNKVVATAAAVNHTLLVTENGQLYSCGLNKYHVLGSNTSNDRELTPIKVQGALRSVKVIGCAAAKLHSVVWTENHAVFTFGTNAGQLGHSKADLFIKKPRQVSAVYNEEDQIASVHACDSATVVATRQGTVYLLQKYVCRKIISKQLDIEQIQVGGGKLDTSALAQVDQRLHATHMQIKEDSLRVLVRKKSGDVLSWSKAHGTLDRCKFNMKQPLLVKEVILCNHGHTGLLITNTGQAFMAKFGQWKPPKPPKRHSATSLSKGYDSCLDMLDADAVQEFLLEQVSGVFRAHSGSLSPKGKSGALLQCEPCNFITEVPIIQESVLVQNMKSLFDGMHENDGICDIIVVATDAKGNKLLSIPCHKYILSSKSSKLRKIIQERCYHNHDDEDRTIRRVVQLDTLIFDQCDPVVLKNMIQYIYCEACDLLHHGIKASRLANGTHKKDVSIYWSDMNSNRVKSIHEVDLNSSAFAVYQNLPKSKRKEPSKHETTARNALSQFKLLAKTLGINRPYFNQFSIQEGIISKKTDSRQQLYNLSYDRHKLREFCDIQLECNDDVIIEAHKCILVARVEFFRSMLISRWAETSSSVSKVPIESKVFGHVLEYVYKDQVDVLENISSVEMLCDIMAAADQFLLQRLKDVAEVQVASKLTLKNVAAIIEFSSMFNCEQLFKTCQQFICQNLPSLMHTPLFYSVDYKTLEECEEFYRANISSVFYRIITPSSEAPTLPDLEPEADETTPTSPFESSSITDNFSFVGQGHGSPQKKKGIMGRRKSSGNKRKSISKHDGVTLSELLAQKDGNLDSLLQRITCTSDIKSTNLPTVPDNLNEHIEDIDKITNQKFEKTLVATGKEVNVLKSPDRVQNSTSESLKGDSLPLSSPGATIAGVTSFRDIMASQARKTPAKPTTNASIQANTKGPWSPGSMSQQYSTTTPRGVVPLKSKKLSQKQRKRLEQEAAKKQTEETVVPNAWGVAQRTPPSSQSFWDVMMEQSSPVRINSTTHAKLPNRRLVQGNQRQKM